MTFKKFNLIIIIIIFSKGFCFGQFPYLNKIDTLNATYKQILIKYREDCIAKNYFLGNYGVVNITLYKNEKNENVMQLSAIIDDSYKIDPPNSYTFIAGSLYFLFSKDSAGNRIKYKNKKQLIKSLNKLVGDRLYIRPPKGRIFAKEEIYPGKFIELNDYSLFGGNTNNVTYYIFDGKGGYKMFKGV